MQDIDTYKTITLKQVIGANTSSFAKDINVEFVPDEIVLKNITFWTSTAYTDAIQLTSDLILGDRVLLTMPKTTSYHESYNVPFRTLNRPVNGNYKFEIKNFSDALVSKASTSSLAFTLVFIKWKK